MVGIRGGPPCRPPHCTTSHNQVPSVNQLVKDHKETLKTRPVCRAKSNQAPNGPLSELIGELLNPYIEAADRKERTEVLSQEELCHEIGEVNRRITAEGMRAGPFQQAGGLIVGSSDVKSFYPEMDMTHSQMLGKFEYTRGPIFKVVLEC